MGRKVDVTNLGDTHRQFVQVVPHRTWLGGRVIRFLWRSFGAAAFIVAIVGAATWSRGVSVPPEGWLMVAGVALAVGLVMASVLAVLGVDEDE